MEVRKNIGKLILGFGWENCPFLFLFKQETSPLMSTSLTCILFRKCILFKFLNNNLIVKLCNSMIRSGGILDWKRCSSPCQSPSGYISDHFRLIFFFDDELGLPVRITMRVAAWSTSYPGHSVYHYMHKSCHVHLTDAEAVFSFVP